MENRLVDRFLKYVAFDTQSDPNSDTFPTTSKQLILADYIKEELEKLGLDHVKRDENGYVTATLASNTPSCKDVVGFVAHLDTAPDFSGKDVKPILHKAYDGKDLIINQETVLSPAMFPFLAHHVGEDIITTDGTTLLGADNKAGIAEIMELLTLLIENPDLPHGTIRVLFTPDEEVGQGTDHVNLEDFKVDYAYTIDGGELGELEFENFNAASLNVTVKGRNIHPGSAKNRMKNAVLMAMEYHQLLPQVEAPQHTEGYEGFYHLNDFNGNVEHVEMAYIIRDHDMDRFEQKKALALEALAFMNKKYGEGTFVADLSDSYFNMREKIEPVMHIIGYVEEAMAHVGIKPLIKPIRGGTDGARLSFMGVPTPNIFTGGYNFHGRYEMIPVQSMEKCVQVLVALVGVIAKQS